MIKKVLSFMVSAVGLFAAMDASAQAVAPRRNLLSRPSVQPSADASAASSSEARAGSAQDEPKEAPALNWDSAPVDIVLQTYAEQTDKTILKDPAAPTPTITLKTREGQKLTREEYLEAIEVVLEMNGIHLEPYGERFIRALPRKDVRKEGIPLIMDPETKLGETGRVVSMMIPFKNIGTDEAQKALEGFKSNSGILLVFERTNSILVTDTEQNINRMLEIARSIDIATPVLENVFVRQIKNANAADIKQALEAIVQESQKQLEKDGKGASNANASTQQSQQSLRTSPPRLLPNNARGTGANQPQVAENNASLVMSVSDADRGMIRGKVLILSDDRSNKLIIVTQKPNMDFFDKVIEQLDVETTPDTVVKVYRLKYAEAEEVSDMINDLIGNTASSSSKSGQNQNANAKSGSGSNLTRNSTQSGGSTAAKKPSNQRTGDAKAGELTKDNTTVLADKRINGLVVMTEKELVPTIEQIIESMDVKLSQVLIETVIIEVQLGDGIDTGVDWIKRGKGTTKTQATDSVTGQKLYYAQRTASGSNGSSTTVLKDSVVPAGYSRQWTSDGVTYTDEASEFFPTVSETVRGGLWSAGEKGFATAGGAGGGLTAINALSGVSTNLLGKGVNYILKSDKLDLSAVIQATKTDSRSKYLASPIVMTVDNKEATVEATEMRYLFKGYQYSGSTYNGTAVPDYEQKEIGITLKMTPKINPNGTIMLTVETEYSQEGAGQKITGTNGQDMNAATTVTRKMSADILLDDMQTAIMGGLTQTYRRESESGIPILKDIPWIGKWLFGSVSQNESRSELLIFMMPYVLDDGAVTQAEAIRRKKTFSDANPWDDHGWSLSELADPVSKKEQMRRLKDEWKKQDEERKTKLTIESEKIKRARALEKMSEDERKFWLEMHKEELEKEQREELEEKMLDNESQAELKALANEVRARKLAEANGALEEAAEQQRQENERGQQEALKRQSEPEGSEEAAGEEQS